jgi:1,2-phenylacetyl-CoA epoxidase PaaB subunit
VLVWDVYGKRTSLDDWVRVGGIKAPDAEMALLLARETHFRHKEGVAYAVKRRGATVLLEGEWPPEQLGGVTDRAYRRQEGYVGVGRKLKRVREELAMRGMAIDRPRPRAARERSGG